MTVLADEQVDENGCAWRSGAKVEQKLLTQWFIKTTRFTKDLLDGLNDPTLEDWGDIIKIQKHWIGECNGVSFNFKLNSNSNEYISVWTDRPEFVDKIKFIAVSSDHLLAKLEENEIFKGTKKLQIVAQNPFNEELIPIFVTDEIKYLQFTDCHVGKIFYTFLFMFDINVNCLFRYSRYR